MSGIGSGNSVQDSSTTSALSGGISGARGLNIAARVETPGFLSNYGAAVAGTVPNPWLMAGSVMLVAIAVLMLARGK